jgi:hypothetical protein
MWGVRERNPQGIGGEVGMKRTQIALINRSGVIQASHKFKACGVLTPWRSATQAAGLPQGERAERVLKVGIVQSFKAVEPQPRRVRNLAEPVVTGDKSSTEVFDRESLKYLPRYTCVEIVENACAILTVAQLQQKTAREFVRAVVGFPELIKQRVYQRPSGKGLGQDKASPLWGSPTLGKVFCLALPFGKLFTEGLNIALLTDRKTSEMLQLSKQSRVL